MCCFDLKEIPRSGRFPKDVFPIAAIWFKWGLGWVVHKVVDILFLISCCGHQRTDLLSINCGSHVSCWKNLIILANIVNTNLLNLWSFGLNYQRRGEKLSVLSRSSQRITRILAGSCLTSCKKHDERGLHDEAVPLSDTTFHSQPTSTAPTEPFINLTCTLTSMTFIFHFEGKRIYDKISVRMMVRKTVYNRENAVINLLSHRHISNSATSAILPHQQILSARCNLTGGVKKPDLVFFSIVRISAPHQQDDTCILHIYISRVPISKGTYISSQWGVINRDRLLIDES